MKSFLALASPLLLVVLVLSAEPAFGETNRYALVVGNGGYAELTKLKNPVNDAHDIGAALESLGFQVDSLADADLSAMEDAVVRLGNRLSTSKDSVGFFFYAGHGVQSNGINYLIPADAHIASEAFLKQKALSVQAVLDTLNDAHNALNVVVLDACRNNPFSWARSGTRGLTVVATQPPGSIIAYATSAGGVAQDGAGRNGVFTASLLKNIRTPGLEIKEVFNRTGADVEAVTQGAQVPSVYNQYFGNAFLSASGSAPPPAAVTTPDRKPVLTVQKEYGSVIVEVQAKGTLSYNGQPLGDVAPGSSARIDDLVVGQATLEMRYADGKTESRAVEIRKNDAATIAFTHVVQPPESGSLTGSWYGKDSNSEGTVEFRGDSWEIVGNVSAPGGGKVIAKGTFTQDVANKSITLSGSATLTNANGETTEQPITNESHTYSISGDTLTLDNPNGSSTTFSRVRTQDVPQKPALPVGFIAYYPFNGNAIDASGHGCNGTVHGATPAVDRLGNPTGAYMFGGSGNYIETLPARSIPSSITVGAWLYPMAPDKQIWGSILNPSGGKNGFATFLGRDGTLSFTYYKGNAVRGSYSSTANLPILNQWVYVTYTVDASGSSGIYVNGRQVGTGTITPVADSHDRPLTFGISLLYQSQYFFVGKIADVRIYGRALSPSEVQSLYDAGG